MKTKLKHAKTIKVYRERAYGYDLEVPVGSTVSNMTALGPDDNYRFWQDFHVVAQNLTGFQHGILEHDLDHRGLNIPAEFCEPWPEVAPFKRVVSSEESILGQALRPATVGEIIARLQLLPSDLPCYFRPKYWGVVARVDDVPVLLSGISLMEPDPVVYPGATNNVTFLC